MTFRVFLCVVLVLGINLSTMEVAFAYLDPGTGSMLIQGLIGAVAAAFVVGRLYWYKIKIFFARMLGKKQPESLLDELAKPESTEDAK